MGKRGDLLESIASSIHDYRRGEILEPTPDHVDSWVRQFDDNVQVPILAEINHVLGETYISKASVEKFLVGLVRNKDFGGENPRPFWRNISFLNIQEGGNSQREMLEMFDSVLQKACNLSVDECGRDTDQFLYLDDGIFTGNRIRNDLMKWIELEAPPEAKVRVVVIALHLGGQGYADSGINKAAERAGKKIEIGWWWCVPIEDRKTYINNSDVLRPTSLPDHERVKAYAESLKYEPILRKPGSVGAKRFFSSEDGRNLLEQEFLKAGVSIRDECPNLNQYQRPLGNMILETLGFGTMIVTFRNCPNNCPLALWAGDPWYPLFPRKVNE